MEQFELEIRPDIKNTIINIGKKYPVKHIGLFGSYARNEHDKNSDVDLYVEFAKKSTLFDLIELKNELESNLHLKVDIVSKKAKIHSVIKKQIQKDLIPLL